MHCKALSISTTSMTEYYELSSKCILKCFCLKKASFGSSVIIKAQKQFICRLGHERHSMLHPAISYVPLVPYRC